MIFYASFIKEDVCAALNKKFLGDSTIYNVDNRAAYYHGNYTMDGMYLYYTFGNNSKIGVGLADEVNYVGQRSGCYRFWNGSPFYYSFYHVLLAR